MSIRVVLADDHRIMRDGLVSLLHKEPDIEVVGQAQDGAGAVALSQQLRPDVVVMDITMPGLNGIEATRRIRAQDPQMKVLCLSMHEETRTVLSAIDAGATGYVLKECSVEELVRAVRKIVADEIYLSAALVRIFVDEYRVRSAAPLAAAPAALTSRERELAQLLSEGHSTRQIAQRLHVSVKTVATHRENILHKLNIDSIAELTRYALREGLSSLDVPCRRAQT